MEKALRRGFLFSALLALALPLISCDSSGSNSGSDGPEYSQVTVKTVTLNEFPFTTDAGEAWDYTSAPDPAIQVVSDEDGSVEATTGSYNNVSRDALPIKYANSPFTISDLSAEYSFELYDADVNEPDFIGGVTYDFNNLTDNYPESKTISAGSLSDTLGLELGD